MILSGTLGDGGDGDIRADPYKPANLFEGSVPSQLQFNPFGFGFDLFGKSGQAAMAQAKSDKNKAILIAGGAAVLVLGGLFYLRRNRR